MPEPTAPSRPRGVSTERRSIDLANGIVETLRRELAEGRYGPDAVFTELALSERFGVSRTPVREALLLLARDGLLVQRDRSFGLPRYTTSDMADLFAVRQKLEPYAIRRIVELCPAREIDAYVAKARAELRAELDADAYIQANRRIHSALLALCRNPHIRDAIEMFDQQTAFIRQKTLRDRATRELSISLTHRLLDAMAHRDATGAEAAAHAALAAAHEAIDRALGKRLSAAPSGVA